jgi:hypothetical protein
MNATRIRFGIITAFAPVYRAIVYDDPSMARLCVRPARMRGGVRSRGTNVTTEVQLDAWLGPAWAIRNG